MTVYLGAPTHRPGGPDGQGWNRLSLNAHMGTPAGQCALQPRSYADLWMPRKRGTVHAQWGNHGRCTHPAGERDGCRGCPILERVTAPVVMSAFTPRVLVRIHERRRPCGLNDIVTLTPHVMNRPEDGWGSSSRPVTWEGLTRLVGWELDGQHRDEHSAGFWLAKVYPGRLDGRPEPCPHEYLNPNHCNQGCKITEGL